MTSHKTPRTMNVARIIAVLVGETFLQASVSFFVSMMCLSMTIMTMVYIMIFVIGAILAIWGLSR